MRSKLFASFVLVTLLSFSLAADARPRKRSGSSKPSQANKSFGLGIILGAPTGLSGKYYLGADTALDFAIGGHYGHRRGHRGLHIHGTFLWHPVVLASPDPFELPLYLGLGFRLLDHDHFFRDRRGHTHLGLRAPFGILFDFNRVPIDIFFELALILDFVTDHDVHGILDLDGAIGFRFYF